MTASLYAIFRRFIVQDRSHSPSATNPMREPQRVGHRFRSNEVRPSLSLIAYGLGNLWRLVLPRKIENWSLTRLQQKAGEDRRQPGQACPVLLADAGREPSHKTALWEHDTSDQCADSGERLKRRRERRNIRPRR